MKTLWDTENSNDCGCRDVYVSDAVKNILESEGLHLSLDPGRVVFENLQGVNSSVELNDAQGVQIFSLKPKQIIVATKNGAGQYARSVHLCVRKSDHGACVESVSA